MQVSLYPHEKTEDLQCKGLRLIQSSREYRFTTDAVLLANFCRDMTGKKCVELCAGSGVISLLLAAKKRPSHITAVELQPQLCDMMRRSVALNDLQEVIDVVCEDVKNFRAQADVVGCAARLLNNKGSFYLVHQSSRLAEIITLCNQSLLAVKEILPVCPSPGKNPNLVLIHAQKQGRSDCDLRFPLSVTDENGQYTPQAKAWYGIQ